MQRVPPDESENIFPENDGPERIEPGLWRIPLPLPFALRSANVYLIDDGDGGWTLVDSGLGLSADEAALRAGLTHAGLALERITALILTHAHPDHIGLSGVVHAASGAPIYLLEGEDERLYGVWADAADATAAVIGAMYAAHGFTPEEVRIANTSYLRTSRALRLAPRAAVRLLPDGGDLRLGAHSYRAIWTPGHSDFHMCLLREDGLFIAGDHILPSITPNIGYYANARPDPLRDYYWSLARVRDLPARLALPGHGRPFADLAGRVDALRAHHEERAAIIHGILERAPDGVTANTIADALFGARLHSPEDRRFALVEVLAHLEYQRHAGRVTRAERDGMLVYAAMAGAGAPSATRAPTSRADE